MFYYDDTVKTLSFTEKSVNFMLFLNKKTGF